MDYQLPSFTKINGIPLLPPLVTNNISTEIQYYKQLAVCVEERLKILETAKKALEKNKNEPVKDCEISTDHCTMTNQSKLQKLTPELVDCSSCEKTSNLIDIEIPTIDETKTEVFNKNESKQNILEQSGKDDDKSCLNDTLLVESISSDTVTASTDLNQYLNTSASSKTDTIETIETTPENWKPQVPMTLDIIPITLDQPKPTDKLSPDSDSTPKLVRQGSYVLEAPSPMLLAHMQNEVSSSEYTPTSSDQSMKRKEWSISQTKQEWKNQSSFKEPTSLHSSSINKFRKSSNAFNQRVSKSVSNSKSGSPLDVYQPTRSADCIQAMFAKECYSKGRSSSHSQKFSSFNGTTSVKNNNSVKKNNKNSSILNSASKLSSSLGSLSNNSPKPVRRIEKKKSQDSNSNKNINSTSSSIISDNSSVSVKKPVITSEKIISVFKEVQDTHKKQMLELMERQQREQSLMQENFKKQQILLLAQVRKAFPEISILALSEAICGKNVEQDTPRSSRSTNEKLFSVQKENEISKMNGFSGSERSNPDTHDLQESNHNHYSTQQNTPSVSPYNQCSSQATQTSDNIPSSFINRFDLSNVRDIDEIPVGNPNRRHSSVSRQLFPHESKTSHLPDISMYNEEHIKAATTINAFAKGFLVRRLMKTEKVIALKNTYREALHCMLRLHVDAPLNLPELNFHQRLQLQCDAASMSIVELFSQSPSQRMEIIAHDREVKKARSDRPNSARSTYSFATRRTLARKKLKEQGAYQSYQSSIMTKSCPARTRCQTWGSNSKERRVTTSMINQGMKRSTSAGAVRKPWR